MKIHINTLKGKLADDHKPSTWDDIAAATGIRKATLIALSKGRQKDWRPEYADALCAFFGVPIEGLFTAEPVELPLVLNLRPDRRGAQVGQKTKED